MNMNKYIGVTLYVCLLGAGLMWAIYTIGQETRNQPFHVDNPKTYFIGADGGGPVLEYVSMYSRINADEKYVRVNTICASACTMFLGLVDPERVCASDTAVFGFHGVYIGAEFSPEWTQLYAQFYPPYVRAMLAERGFDGTADVDASVYPTGFIWLTRDELGIQHCPESRSRSAAVASVASLKE